VLNPKNFYSKQQTELATQPSNTPQGTAGERLVTSAEIDAEIDHRRTTVTHSCRKQEQARISQDIRDSVLDQILERIRRLRDRVNRLEVTNYDHYINHYDAKTITNY